MSEIDRSHSLTFGSSRAYTLLELLIIIVLLSLFALLVFGSMKRTKPAEEEQGVPAIRRLVDKGKKGDLVCIEKCQKCFLIGEDHQANEIALELPPVTAYAIDALGNPERLDFGRYHDKKICLRFRYFSNGSTSQMILKTKERVFYFLPAYFGKVLSFEKLDEAAKYWMRNSEKLRDRGDFY
jgi:hypothetical protein